MGTKIGGAIVLAQQGDLTFGYTTTATKRLLSMAKDDIATRFDALGKPDRDRLFEVAVELADNARRYGQHPSGLVEFTVATDARGTYVEVNSAAEPKDVARVERQIAPLRRASDEELYRKEVEIGLSNVGSNRSGLGLLHVARHAAWSDQGRMLEVRRTELDGRSALAMRCYVKT